MRLAIIGAGSVRCSVPVIASLGSYFGERPMEIALYDADSERLELFELFARVTFSTNKTPHGVSASANAADVLEGASKVVLQVDANCSLKEARLAGAKPPADVTERVSRTLERLLPDVHPEAQVISLLPAKVRVPLDYYYRLDWPAEPNEEEIRALPHQVMRWVRGEEYVFGVLKEFERSPFKKWLDDVNSATIVSEA